MDINDSVLVKKRGGRPSLPDDVRRTGHFWAKFCTTHWVCRCAQICAQILPK